MKFCLKKSTFSFGLSQNVNNNAPQAKRSVNFNTFCHTSHLKIFSYIIKPASYREEKTPENLLSSSYVLIRNKTYINFVLAQTIHFILHVEKSQFGKVVLGHQMKNNSILLQITSLYTDGP